LTGKSDYPQGIIEIIRSKVDTTVINAADMAVKLGNPRTMNIVLFGALVKGMELTGIDWEAAIRKNVKAGTADINVEAFKAGTAVGVTANLNMLD
jgi:indolepyruvate ferredoxin oxidoreductase beta subunit